MSQRLLVCALVGLAVLPAAAKDRPAAEPKRGAYVVQYAAAKDLAGLLARHFKGTAEIQPGPEGTSNCLLIKAPPAVFQEVMKTLEKLDRRPHSVAVEIFVVEFPAKKEEEEAKRPDEKDFSGGIDDVAKRLDKMMKKGQVAAFTRVQLTTLEGQLGRMMLGEVKPYKTGENTRSYRNVGTRVRVTPQVAADRSVTLDLNVEDSRGRASADDPDTTEFIITALAGKVRIASGKAVLAKDAKVTSKAGKGEMLIVVGARVVEPGAKAKKVEKGTR
jgi:type II secretory pathway component GspD/PulD (secretin)